MSMLPERLDEMLTKRGISQKHLADASGVTAATVSRYRSNSADPTLFDMLVAFAKKLNCSVDYLLGVSNVEQPYNSVPDDELLLTRCYERLTPDDRTAVWSILYKYVAPNDRDKLPCTILVPKR